MKIHVLKMGALDMPANVLYGDGYSATETEYCPIYCLAIETNDGVILFDTGVNTDKGYIETYIECGNHFDLPDDCLVNRLKSIGIEPGDVKKIVLSHLHYDHAGNIEKFPNAEIIVSKTEFTEIMSNYGMGKCDIVVPENYIELWAHSKLNWTLLDEDELEISKGVKVFRFGSGHSYGMLAMMIESKDLGNIFAVSDMAYTPKSYKEKIAPGILLDKDGYISSLSSIDEIAAEYNATVWCGHDPNLFKNIKWAPEGYYN